MNSVYKFRHILAVCLFVFVGTQPIRAQGFSYTSTTQIDIQGDIGTLLSTAASLVGGNEIVETVSVLGDRHRVDRGSTSTITDLEWQTITTVNHDDETFSVVTFDSILEKIESARSQLDTADFALEEAGVSVESDENLAGIEEAPLDEGRAVVFDLQTEWTGQKKRMNRLPAEQAYLTLIAESKESEGESDVISGTFVAFNDMWLTKEVNGYDELTAYNAKAANIWGTSIMGKGGLDKLQSTLLGDARTSAMLESVRTESQKIEGIPILTETYLVLVDKNETFNKDLVLAKTPKRRGLKGALSAVRKSIQKAPGSGETAGQRTLVKVSITLDGFKTSGLTEDDFNPPSNYTEIISEEE